MTDFFAMVGAAFVLVMVLTAALWSVYRFQKNASVLDIGWGIGFIVTVWSYFFLRVADNWKMLILAVMVTVWGIRLTQHLWRRYIVAQHEDPRYTLLQENWPVGDHSFIFLMLYSFQGILILFLSVPFLLVANGSHWDWTHWEIWGIVVWCLGVAGETLVDKQLTRFHADPDNQNKVCREGLWKYSRHPNYFFEILVWVGFALFAYPSNWGIFAFFSPIAVTFLLLKVSGVPLTEAQAIRSKGDSYREYQRTTSVLIPWFPSK